MNSILSMETFSKSMRQILVYYVGFCIILMIIQLALVSLVAFFHFLLDHDMAVVENWLNYNAWEILVVSKFSAFFLMIRIIRLNLYDLPKFRRRLFRKRWIPNLEAIVFVIFMNVMVLAIVDTLGGGFKFFNQREYNLVFISYIGNIVFYLIDVFLIFDLFETFEIKKKRNKLILIFLTGLTFLITTNVLQPYGKPDQLIIFLYFVTLLLSYFKNPKNLGNTALILFFQVAFFIILYGHDLVWKKQNALVNYQGNIPIIGVLLSWLIGMFYFFKKRQVD